MSEEAASTGTEATTEAVEAPEGTLVTGAENATESETEQTEGEAATTEEASEGEGDPDGGDNEDGDQTDGEGAPEEYAEFTMPDGIELDGELAGEFKAAAKELNLTQEQAQRVVDLGAKMRQRDVEAIIALRGEWVDQTKADKEIGGDQLDANLAVAKKAMAAYGSDAFVKLLNETGLGNHPEVVRFMAKAGRSVSEDTVVKGNGQTPTPQGSLASRIFGSSKE